MCINRTKIEKQILKYDWVSFDIFDTLVRRCVPHPTDLFALVEVKYNALHPQQPITDFKRNRIEAENTARENSALEEIQFDDIYNYISFPENVKIELKSMETEAEYDLCKPNEIIAALFDKCIEQNKNVVITSNMYLSKEVITTILNKCGIKGYKKLYLSSQENKSKASGNLFKLIMAENHLKSNQIIHVGDSFKNDYIRPLSLGMHAVWIRQRKSQLQLDGKSLLECIISAQEKISYDYYQKFGYECFGPLLWGYTCWLVKNLKKKEIEKVYFLSRDGYIIQKAFELISHDSNIRKYYLEVSRRSLRAPILWMIPSFEQLITTLSIAKKISVRTFFDSVGLDVNDYKNLILSCNLTEDSFFYRESLHENSTMRKLFQTLKGDIETNSKREFNLLKEYLQQMNVEGKFAIVDIGWSGSMHRFLQKTLNSMGINNEITGFYTGVTSSYARHLTDGNLNLNGYLFDYSHQRKHDETSPFVGLYETLFLEGKGSVKRYKKVKDGSITAERYPYEYEKNVEEALIVKKIQESALQFIRDIKSIEIIQYIKFSSNDLFYNLKKVGHSPTWKDIRNLGKLHFYDGGETTTLGNGHFILYYFLHPNQFKKSFLSSRWKIAFLKRLLIIPFPYILIYRFLKKVTAKDNS